MSDNESLVAANALNSIISTLAELDEATRRRVLQAASTFFEVGRSTPTQELLAPSSVELTRNRPSFSDDYSPSVKQFMLEKQPKTDVERIACLAYYLTNFRETPYFKTLDLAKLNTEAAQPKFSNAAYAATNATKMGYLAPAIKGQRQISAAGEQFVRALPDRDAAKLAMSNARPRRSNKRKSKASQKRDA